MVSKKNSRWDEIRRIQIESASAYHILGAVLLVLFGVWLGSRFFSGDSGFGSNLWAEFLGIIATYFIIDYLHARHNEKRREQDLKDRLLHEVRSPEGTISRHAFFELQEKRLIYGESSILRNAFLQGAKPVRTDLRRARLNRANLVLTDFSETLFHNANIEEAKLMEAKLDDAVLVYANLKNADLQGAYLTRANLAGADLRGANLRHVQMQNANFAMIGGSIERIDLPEKLSETTILPDGDSWKPGIDMNRFTDPDHPEFWRSSDPSSPAHHSHPNSYFDFLSAPI